MNEVLLNTKLNNLNSYLLEDEKDRAESTIRKYKSIARDFLIWTYDTKGISLDDMSRTFVKEYRTELMRHYENYRTLNNRISIVNVYLKSANLNNCTVATLDYEEDMCKPDNRYLTKDEYERLISCDNEEFEDEVLMALIFGSTAIRVSELQYFIVEAAETNRVYVVNKGKKRPVYVSDKLKDKIRKYCAKHNVVSGPILLSNRKKPYDRTSIWYKLKKLAVEVGVDPHKVFPHSFRHLFALEHYNKNHDIEALSRILGHKSTKTTEIYIRKTASEYAKTMDIWEFDNKKCDGRIKLSQT